MASSTASYELDFEIESQDLKKQERHLKSKRDLIDKIDNMQKTLNDKTSSILTLQIVVDSLWKE